jgi:poly-beta-1,6 N-acetyl-D-glucosamine export porin PgaA
LRADTLLALYERGQHAQVVQRFEQWRASGYAIPAYGLATVAGSYAWLRRSDLAVPLYEQALRESAPNLPSDISASLVYAYLDTGRVAEAQALLERRGQGIAPYLAQAPRRQSPSRDFDDHQALRASLALTTDRLDEGERLFDELAASAPMSADLQLGRVRAQQLRDHPRAARALLDGVRAEHPASPTVQLAHADLLLDQGEFSAAHQQLQALETDYPQDGRVLRARERYDQRTAARLEMRLGGDRGGGALYNRETSLDLRGYSPVIGDGVRLMGRQVRQHASLGDGRTSSVRTGLGVQVEHGPYWLQAELHRESLRGHSGIEIDAAWRLSDPWRLRAHVDTFSLDTPWRAKTNGVRMARADVGLRWIDNESRWLDLSLQTARFTDRNRRDEWSASWHERWVSQPAWQLSTTADMSAGRHTRQDVAYFSPRSYAVAQAWGRAQWLSWRRDQRRLLQVIELGGGFYRQADHGSKPMYGVRLSHEWALGRGWSFFYGLSWMRRPYDGVHEVQRSLFMGFVLPLS